MGEKESNNRRRKRLIRKSDQGAACGHPYERRDDRVSLVEMMNLGCDDRGCAFLATSVSSAESWKADFPQRQGQQGRLEQQQVPQRLVGLALIVA